ncbi:hypothetical protein [Siccirubricoccus phaeus]|uniref:hypothetical protein n=1 Tax=Siccirubricoccus phaeus TaxID=2595053 RepID=UPI0011F3B7C7|nr:hypothetical protein [Siccirubricoccus phaeus]
MSAGTLAGIAARRRGRAQVDRLAAGDALHHGAGASSDEKDRPGPSRDEFPPPQLKLRGRSQVGRKHSSATGVGGGAKRMVRLSGAKSRQRDGLAGGIAQKKMVRLSGEEANLVFAELAEWEQVLRDTSLGQPHPPSL